MIFNGYLMIHMFLKKENNQIIEITIFGVGFFVPIPIINSVRKRYLLINDVIMGPTMFNGYSIIYINFQAPSSPPASLKFNLNIYDSCIHGLLSVPPTIQYLIY